MNRKNCLLLALTAGSALAIPAMAQDGFTRMEMPDGSFKMVPTKFETITNMASPAGYDSRAVSVLDNATGLFTLPSRTTLGCNHTLDVFSFSPGPWATSPVRNATAWSIALVRGDWVGANSPAFNLHLKAYNATAFATTVGASMIPAGATVAGDITYNFPDGFWNASKPGPGYIITTQYPSIGLAAGDLSFTGAGMLLEVSIEEPVAGGKLAYYASGAATNPLGAAAFYIAPGEAAATQQWFIPFCSKPTSPGSAPDVGYGRDINGDGTFTYAAVVSGGGFTTPTDIRDYRNSGNIHYPISIQGDVVPTPPAADVALGCLSDGNTDATISGRAPGGFKAISFCLKGDATDSQRRFLDIIGDNANGTDFSIGVYNIATGGLAGTFGSDDNSGDSATGAPQLSFGVGRRAKPVSTAQPLDGRNGEVLAGNYMALVSGPGAGFGDGYIVNVPDVSLDAGGSETIHFRTNTNAGVNAASDAPDPADYAGSVLTLPPSVNGGAGVQAAGRAVTWYKFDLCENVSDTLNGEYLDIDLGRTGGGSPQTQVILFDSNGNIVGNNTNTGTAVTSQLSFSDASAPARTPANPAASPLAGQNGTLAAGTYYICAGLSAINTLVAGDRWHVRPTSGSSFPVPVDINTNIDCTEETGCPCVADFDLSGGTPDASDIDAFFGAWLLGDPAADSDCSGGTPDASDIDQFFIEWLAGGC